MVKNLSCVSHGSLKRFPHRFTNTSFTVQIIDYKENLHSAVVPNT